MPYAKDNGDKSSAGVSHGITQYSPSIGGFGALWHIGGSGRQGIQASPGASGEWEQPDGSRETSPGSGENNSWPATTEEIAEISQPSWHIRTDEWTEEREPSPSG